MVPAPKLPEAPELPNKELSGKEVALHATRQAVTPLSGYHPRTKPFRLEKTPKIDHSQFLTLPSPLGYMVWLLRG